MNQHEALIAIMTNKIDYQILREQLWYRIPVSSANKWLKKRWPPHWLAFYQTKKFGEERYAVHYYGEVIRIRKAYRWQLFPNEILNNKSERQYHQLFLRDLKKRLVPIRSRTWRRIVFIPTTWTKFINAGEMGDLFDDSPLEDRLWAALKGHDIQAIR